MRHKITEECKTCTGRRIFYCLFLCDGNPNRILRYLAIGIVGVIIGLLVASGIWVHLINEYWPACPTCVTLTEKNIYACSFTAEGCNNTCARYRCVDGYRGWECNITSIDTEKMCKRSDDPDLAIVDWGECEACLHAV